MAIGEQVAVERCSGVRWLVAVSPRHFETLQRVHRCPERGGGLVHSPNLVLCCLYGWYSQKLDCETFLFSTLEPPSGKTAYERACFASRLQITPWCSGRFLQERNWQVC